MMTVADPAVSKNWIRLSASPEEAFSVSRIDREQRLIIGFVVASAMVARGHDLELDQQTLEQLVELGNADPLGIKCRVNHPSPLVSAYGTFIGRVTNFRLDNNLVRADLKLALVAFHSPKGDWGQYTLDLAEEDPAAFGASIVIKGRPELRRNPDGTLAVDPETGAPLPVLVRVVKFKAVDLVDDPGATDAFFSDSDQAMQLSELQSPNPLQKGTIMSDKQNDSQTPDSGKTPDTTPATPEAGKTPAPATAQTATAAATGTAAVAPHTEKLAAGQTLQDVRLDAAKSEAKRQSDIRALCATAGMENKADHFCENITFSVGDVREVLFDSICKRNTTPADDAGAAGQSAADPDLAFKEEYREHVTMFAEQDISEEQYVASRRVDEGLENLPMLTAAK